jgi:hypothetical protein
VKDGVQLGIQIDGHRFGDPWLVAEALRANAIDAGGRCVEPPEAAGIAHNGRDRGTVRGQQSEDADRYRRARHQIDKAAREALTKLGVWQEAERKIVIGENITQTAQFVETGNADAGFVAMSLVLSPKLKDKGRWQEIDADLYSPLEQGAVITRRGGNNPASARFLTFLSGPEARAVLERFGYRVPRK